MPPIWNNVVTRTACAIGRPPALSNVGSQLLRKFITSMFMKNDAQSSNVIALRPSVNRLFTTVMPLVGARTTSSG